MSAAGANIKLLAQELCVPMKDLIVLAPQNDPFASDTPAQRRDGEWLADLWHTLTPDGRAHLRYLHYKIVSQDPPIAKPNGEPYLNTEKDWELLGKAASSARNLRLLPSGAFVDKRNPPPMLYMPETPEPGLNIYEPDAQFAMPRLPDLPTFDLTDFEAPRRYSVEMWLEKSTMNEVLIPLCEAYGVNLVTAVGETSFTACEWFVRRAIDHGKPTRILYISDFDPAGKSMPVSAQTIPGGGRMGSVLI